METQIYQNLEHPRLGPLHVVEATPIEGDITELFQSNFTHQFWPVNY